jgi:hypothetical protein
LLELRLRDLPNGQGGSLPSEAGRPGKCLPTGQGSHIGFLME